MTNIMNNSVEGWLQLADEATFDEDERLFAQVAIGWARRSGTMFEGRLLEAHVGRLLGARFPETAISSWDLLLDDHIRIQVRSAARGGCFKLGDGHHAGAVPSDVWVLVEKPLQETTEAREHLRYWVLTRQQVDSIGHKTISHSKVDLECPPCGRAELAERVRRAAANRPNLRRRSSQR